MTRNKTPDHFPEEPSPFSEGQVVQSWDAMPTQDRGMVNDIVAARTQSVRPSNQYSIQQKGKLYWPKEKVPPGYSYSWHRIRLNNQDDIDNFHESLMNEWEPVAASDHPDYKCIDAFNDVISERYPGSIRKGGMILMKQPKHIFDAQQQYYVDESEHDQKATSLMNEYGQTSSVPTHLVANEMKYTPNSR